jgi:hypothetical protein
MRTFEALGAKKKLITTNSNIINYSFYNKNNILVIDRIDPKIPPSFFQTKFENIEGVTYDKLTLQGWIQELFAEDYIVHWKFETNE